MHNVQSSAYHGIHQTSNCTRIKNMRQFFFFFFFSTGTLFYRYSYTHRNRKFYWLTLIHIKHENYCLNIFSLVQLTFSFYVVSLNIHPQDEIGSTKILHVKLGGQLQFHHLNNLHDVSNQQHVIYIQHYKTKIFYIFLSIDIVISFSSHKSLSEHVCFKLLVPHPWRLLQKIKGLLQFAYHILLTLYSKLFKFLHVYFLFQVSVQEHCFYIHLFNLQIK